MAYVEFGGKNNRQVTRQQEYLFLLLANTLNNSFFTFDVQVVCLCIQREFDTQTFFLKYSSVLCIHVIWGRELVAKAKPVAVAVNLDDSSDSHSSK